MTINFLLVFPKNPSASVVPFRFCTYLSKNAFVKTLPLPLSKISHIYRVRVLRPPTRGIRAREQNWLVWLLHSDASLSRNPPPKKFSATPIEAETTVILPPLRPSRCAVITVAGGAISRRARNPPRDDTRTPPQTSSDSGYGRTTRASDLASPRRKKTETTKNYPAIFAKHRQGIIFRYYFVCFSLFAASVKNNASDRTLSRITR